MQRRLHQEIDEWDERNSGPESEEKGNKDKEDEEMMLKTTTTLLDAVIRESLRMFPPVSRIARRMNQQLVIRGSVSGLEYVLPEGTTVTIDIFQIQRDPAVFPDPDTFDPDRFLIQRTTDSTKKVFMPFSLGPRSCIGSKFALLELKIFLIKVLRKFTLVSRTPVHELNLAVEIVLKPNKGNIEILFVERAADKNK